MHEAGKTDDGVDLTGRDDPGGRGRFPAWLRKRIPAGAQAAAVQKILHDLKLPTVCTGAHCPNLPECFADGTATFMILGDCCTRNCRFCAVLAGGPQAVRADEPQAVAEGAAKLGLRHVVITSVTRDDLPDGGARHFAETVRAVRSRLARSVIEVLIPDFQGCAAALECVLEARADVLNHNVETVPRLYGAVRPQADYQRSLTVLQRSQRYASAAGLEIHTKSGLMVGLGESDDEVLQSMRDLREVGCEILTIGQYLQPSPEHLPVRRFVHPDVFDEWRQAGEQMGFVAVAAGPFVRSSYHAETLFNGRTK